MISEEQAQKLGHSIFYPPPPPLMEGMIPTGSLSPHTEWGAQFPQALFFSCSNAINII